MIELPGWDGARLSPSCQRIAWEYAKDLHTLLAKANEPGPYVLVGHSMGGYTVRVYAHDYPAGVSGLVLIDLSDLPISSHGSTSLPPPKPGGTSLPSLLALALAWRACWRILLAYTKTCRRK